MENNRIATTIMVVLMSLEIGVAEILTKPTITEVVVGGSTFLNCSTNIRQEIHWFHTPVGPTQERNFVYGYDQFYTPYIGRFRMEKNETNGAYNLVIPSVKIEDAGVYECQEETGRGSKASAQLIVLDTNPVCEPHMDTHEIIGPNKCGIEPNELILSCTVKYLGNEAPLIAWRRASDNISVGEGVTLETMDNNRVVYNLTIKGNSTVKDEDSYFCDTTRSAMSNYGCISGRIKIKGTVVDCPPCTDDQICKPYIDAIICILLIIIPVAVSGTVLLLWYLRVYRPEKLQQIDNRISNVTTVNEAGTTEEMVSLQRPASSLGDSNNDRKSKIKTLENEISLLQKRIQRRDQTIMEGHKTINDLTQNDQSNKAEIKSLRLENDQLQKKVKENDQLHAKVKELELRLYPKENIDYADKPILAHTIELSQRNEGQTEKNKGKSENNKGKFEEDKGKSIIGITVLGKDLLVVTKHSHEIEVYDSKTFQHKRSMEIIEMTDPLDIASSKDAKCIYVVGLLSEETASKVVRFDPRGNALNHWLTGGSKGRLSTCGCNVILCLSDKNLIREYSPEGDLIVTVRLSPAAKLNNPLHAIKVTSTCFVVSHGDFNDELHRVCVVDLDGEIMKECTKWKKASVASNVTMKVPICLVEDNERSIIVADTDNKRILLLSSMLKYQRKLIEKENGLKDSPARLCFDDTQSRLFVAVNKWSSSNEAWEGGRILIYNVK